MSKRASPETSEQTRETVKKAAENELHDIFSKLPQFDKAFSNLLFNTCSSGSYKFNNEDKQTVKNVIKNNCGNMKDFLSRILSLDIGEQRVLSVKPPFRDLLLGIGHEALSSKNIELASSVVAVLSLLGAENKTSTAKRIFGTKEVKDFQDKVNNPGTSVKRSVVTSLAGEEEKKKETPGGCCNVM